MRELPVDASPGVVKRRIRVRAGPRAPAAADPRADTPQPPARNLGVIPFGIVPEIIGHALQAFVDKPEVAAFEVAFVNRPIGVVRDRVRIGGERAPEIRQVAILIVDGFHSAAMPSRTFQQHGARTEERFAVMIYIAERGPDFRSYARFAAEPGKRRFHTSIIQPVSICTGT